MKRITLCADDYGMHPCVSGAIIKLAKLEKIQATSCLVTSRHWTRDAERLQEIKDKVDIGLHLNFSEGQGLSASYMDKLPGLNTMLIASHLRLLNKTALVEEITAQYQAFMEATGQQPDFIDGHQHVHHLPVVRDALMTVIRRFQPSDTFWVRSTTPMIQEGAGFKGKVIEKSGASALRTLLNNQDINTNSAFAGTYSLSPEAPYRLLMQQWLKQLPDRGLIMCHPGVNLENTELDHAQARQQEFHYLAGDLFSNDCQSADVEICRLR